MRNFMTEGKEGDDCEERQKQERSNGGEKQALGFRSGGGVATCCHGGEEKSTTRDKWCWNGAH